MNSLQYVVRPAEVVHDTIDGETVVIDMESGSCYLLEGAASIVWEQLIAGATVENLCAILAARFVTEPAILEKDVGVFLDSLRTFNLIEPDERIRTAVALPKKSNEVNPFPGLAIRRFTDLQELLLIDPVHDVDDTGWPTLQSPLRTD